MARQLASRPGPAYRRVQPSAGAWHGTGGAARASDDPGGDLGGQGTGGAGLDGGDRETPGCASGQGRRASLAR